MSPQVLPVSFVATPLPCFGVDVWPPLRHLGASSRAPPRSGVTTARWGLMTNWTMGDLEYWDDRVRELVAEFGLDCYPQEFEVCDQNRCWATWPITACRRTTRTGASARRSSRPRPCTTTASRGLPYEMVINCDPALAYLMRDNSLCLQILTIAHVYGHNDFFKNNFTFTSGTDAKETLASFKARADRVRGYIEDPSIGVDAVEEFLDAAHAPRSTARATLPSAS